MICGLSVAISDNHDLKIYRIYNEKIERFIKVKHLIEAALKTGDLKGKYFQESMAFTPFDLIKLAIDKGLDKDPTIQMPVQFVEWYKEQEKIELENQLNRWSNLFGKYLMMALDINESACLLCGLDPSKISCGGDGYISFSYYKGTSEEKTRFEEMERLIKDALALEEFKSDVKYPQPKFRPQKIIKWAIGKKLNIPAPLLDWYQEQNQPSEPPPPPEQIITPLNRHRSELLDILHEAITDLWENHDPETPPTLAILEVWFNQKGYTRTKNEIMAIDKIMRPDRYKGGKNNK